MDKEKFQAIGDVVNLWGLKGDLKVLLKPHLKLNPNKKIKLLFYSQNNHLGYFPLKVAKFREQGNYYLLKLANSSAKALNLSELKNIELYSLIVNNEFLNKNWWKDYRIIIDEHTYKIHNIWNNGHYDLAEIDYLHKLQWVPLTGVYIDFINHDRKRIYLNKVGVLNEV